MTARNDKRAGKSGTGGDHEATEPEPRSMRDWTALRRRYATGAESLSMLSAATGIPLGSLKKRSSADGWEAARESFRAKTDAKATDAAAQRKIEAEAEIDGIAHEAAVELAKKLSSMVAGLEDPAQGRALAAGLADAWAIARKTAHLAPEPTVNVAAAQQTVFIVRGGEDEDAVEPVKPAADGGGGSSELPPDPDAAAVPAVA